MKKKIQRGILVALLMCVAFCVVGTSLAWLQDATTPVVNEFTPSDVTVNLTETGIDKDGKKSFDMIPGHYMDKDPKAWVDEDSEDCYLFVEVTETGGNVTVDGTTYDFDDFIDYEIDSAWTQLMTDVEGNALTGVYYIEFDSEGDDKTANVKGTQYALLAGGSNGDMQNMDPFVWKANQVLTKPTVTRDMMKALDAEGAVKPTLTFKAYAVQLYKTNNVEFTAAEAWALAK